MKEIITAIDIGTTKIVALAGERDENGRIRILAKGTVPTPQKSVKMGVVQNIETVSKAIKEAVQKAENTSDIEFTSAFIGIAGHHIKSVHNNHSIVIKSPENIISKDDVERMTQEIRNLSLEANEEILDVIPQNYSIDKENGIDEPVGRIGKILSGNYHIIIGETTAAKHIKRCVELSDIKVNDLYLEPIASSKAVLTEDEKEAGVALVDIGGGTTDLAIYYEGILRHTAVIPFGGDVITKDVKEAYKILHKHAEELKTDCGTALSEFAKKDSLAVIPGISGRDSKEISLVELSKVIQARMEEIINIINFEIINSGYRDKLAAGIALTGGGSLLDKLPQLMKFVTGLDVKLSKPPMTASSGGARVNSPKLSTAVGLVILGFENIEKAEQPNKKKRKKEKTNKNGLGIKGIFDKISQSAKQKAINFFDDDDTVIE
ncbi:MAG: cell division protein FtsA [Bacteroidales bacterium]|nr:cell division protein FtsA [Bacteroidales bacterium]